MHEMNYDYLLFINYHLWKKSLILTFFKPCKNITNASMKEHTYVHVI